MKRGLLRSILGLAVVFAMANVSFAQTHDGTAVTGYATTAYANEGSVYVMEGKTIPVFAQPDAYYHPSWNAGTATWTLTDGFTWVWTVPAGLTASQNNAEDNYNEITADAGSAAGSPYTLSVVETAPAAYGSCAGAGTNLTINVVTQPAATLGGTPTYEGCEGDVGFPANINATVSGGWQNYRLVWNLDIRTVDNLGALVQQYDSDQATAIAGLAEDNTTAAPFDIAAAGATDLMTVGSFDVIDSKTTVYTYTLVSINDQASRNGDFIGLTGDAADESAFTYYAAADTYVVTVHPAPVTGPIYQIPSTWAQ